MLFAVICGELNPGGVTRAEELNHLGIKNKLLVTGNRSNSNPGTCRTF